MIGKATLPGIPGEFVIEDDQRTTALTAVEHSIFYVVGGKRKQVFNGYGGIKPVLTLSSPRHAILTYCGGSILKVQSSFFADQAKSTDIIRLQVVTDPGLSVAGRMVC